MEYITPPKTINYKQTLEKSFCLAPSKYSKFNPKKNPKNITFELLGDLIKTSEERKEIEPKKQYFYIEIGSINVNTGGIDYNLKIGLNVPQKRPLKLKKRDIIISKVRTYRKGIAYVNNRSDKLVCTPAFLVIRKVKNNITKEFLYSVLRHNFFVEQILSLQNRGMYPRLDKTTKKEVLIPVPHDEKIINYITKLTKSIINKEEKIKNRFDKIDTMVEKEIRENQKSNLFTYNLPNFKEVKGELRLSASIYSKEYKYLTFLIRNYKNGFFNLNPESILSGNTPKERIFDIGKIWVTPTDINNDGTLNKNLIFCKKYNLSKDSLLIINRGREEDVGVSMFYDFKIFGEGQHNQGIYRIEKLKKDDLILITCLMNSKIYRRICANLSLGSKMDEMKTKHFAILPFPNFQDKIKKEIKSLYYNGIIKLNKQIVEIQDELKELIDYIIKDKKISIR